MGVTPFSDRPEGLRDVAARLVGALSPGRKKPAVTPCPNGGREALRTAVLDNTAPRSRIGPARRHVGPQPSAGARDRRGAGPRRGGARGGAPRRGGGAPGRRALRIA